MLNWEFTAQWKPNGDGTFYSEGGTFAGGGFGGLDGLLASYGALQNVLTSEVHIGLNARREASITMSIWDAQLQPLADNGPYRVMLRGRWTDPKGPWGSNPNNTDFTNSAQGTELLFWGCVTQYDVDVQNETVTIHAVDVWERLACHYIRLGDLALNTPIHPDKPNSFDRRVPLNGTGYWMVIDAAQNLEGTQEDTYPPLGIAFNHDDSPVITPSETDKLVKFARGDEVASSLDSMISNQLAPDVEFNPIETVAGVYVNMNVYDFQGNYDANRDREFSDFTCAFESGHGKDNCTIVHRPGGRQLTHIHVLAKNGYRLTEASGDLAEMYGVRVAWENTDFRAAEKAVLRQRGEQLLNAYGNPPDIFDIALNDDCTFRYLRDFMVGTYATVAYRKGVFEEYWTARITGVTISSDETGRSHQQIEAIPHNNLDTTEES